MRQGKQRRRRPPWPGKTTHCGMSRPRAWRAWRLPRRRRPSCCCPASATAPRTTPVPLETRRRASWRRCGWGWAGGSQAREQSARPGWRGLGSAAALLTSHDQPLLPCSAAAVACTCRRGSAGAVAAPSARKHARLCSEHCSAAAPWVPGLRAAAGAQGVVRCGARAADARVLDLLLHHPPRLLLVRGPAARAGRLPEQGRGAARPLRAPAGCVA